MAVAAGVLLFLTQTATRLSDAVSYFDRSLVALLNGFARRSWAFDTSIWGLSMDVDLQGGVLMALFWGAWFATGDTPTGREKRVVMLSSLLALYAAVFVALVVRTTALPFRPRPLTDPAIAFQVPYLPHGVVLSPNSTSFPSPGDRHRVREYENFAPTPGPRRSSHQDCVAVRVLVASPVFFGRGQAVLLHRFQVALGLERGHAALPVAVTA